jgi:predicted DNA binding CopG/RHH family protein
MTTYDSTDYLDWSKASSALFPNLKPMMNTISLRLPQPMLNRLKVLANERDVLYQSLLKMFLKERIDRELQ